MNQAGQLGFSLFLVIITLAAMIGVMFIDGLNTHIKRILQAASIPFVILFGIIMGKLIVLFIKY